MKKVVFLMILALVGFSGVTIYQYVKFRDGRLHVIFCNVGQGDGILIVTPGSKHILVDAGPDNKILDCLSRHLPFWERTIDLALLTHPHADHLMGYYYVIERYNLSQFSTEKLINKTEGFQGLQSLLKEHKIKEQLVAKGDRWRLSDGVVITIAGPTSEFLIRKNPDGVITNSAESGSLITKITYGKFSVLLTGDAPVDEMQEAAGELSPPTVLQIPHHGSSTGIDGEVLDLLRPEVAVISVGKNNYGHPTRQTLKLLQERQLKVLRTDEIGDVEIISNGKN